MSGGTTKTKWMAVGAVPAVVVAVTTLGWWYGPGSSTSLHETKPGDQAPAIGLSKVAREVDRCADCPRLVYVWSPSMPLSEEGMPEIRSVSEDLDVPVTMVSAESLQRLLAEPPSEDELDATDVSVLRSLAEDLVEAGGMLHFPSVSVFQGSAVQGPSVLGYRRAAAYVRLLAPRVEAVRAGVGVHPVSASADLAAASADPVSASVDLPNPGEWATEDVSAETPSPVPPVEIVWRLPVSPTPGAFFRRVPGTRYVAYDQSRDVWLHHLESGERFQGPGWIDFVPTPDGALFVTPADGSGGLEFYDAREVLREGRAGRGEQVRPVYVDPAMSDQYPSVGILEGEPGERVRYRILISWFQGLAIREYDVRWSADGAVRIDPVTEKIDACPGMGLSTPILSKDGQEIAARDESTGTTRLFRVEADGSCEPVLDFGRGTSKVGFSDDGRLIAFGSTEGVTAGSATGRSRTFVFDRESGETVQIPGSGSRSLVIPEFVGPDSVLFLASPDPRRRDVEFRMACCVR